MKDNKIPVACHGGWKVLKSPQISYFFLADLLQKITIITEFNFVYVSYIYSVWNKLNFYGII